MKQAVDATYAPPTLPEYLKKVSDLKPILGSPSDDEVQRVHAVLRMAHSVIHVPGMFDPALLMGLAQHLFEIQMARYREKYPCGMFPEDMVHTPPTLPSHIPVTLEPVHGVPSDEELQSAQAAIRAYEQTAIVPSMFDPKTGMELSQHLFNIQLARYMHSAPKSELGSKPEPRSKKKKADQSSQSRFPVDPAIDTSDDETPAPPTDAIADEAASLSQPIAQSRPIREDIVPGIKGAGTEQFSEKLLEVLEVIKHAIISAHQSNIRSARHERYGRNYGKSDSFYIMGYEMMNDKGVLPTTRGLPQIGRKGCGCSYTSLLSDSQLAQYLQFYGIGQHLIETGDSAAIQEGQRDAAENILSNFVN